MVCKFRLLAGLEKAVLNHSLYFLLIVVLVACHVVLVIQRFVLRKEFYFYNVEQEAFLDCFQVSRCHRLFQSAFLAQDCFHDRTLALLLCLHSCALTHLTDCLLQGREQLENLRNIECSLLLLLLLLDFL